MAYIGKNPKLNSLTFQPQSVEPANPVEGLQYYDDGTNRLEGLYVYRNGEWSTAGSGGGGVDTYLTEDFEGAGVSSFTSGNNATFKNAGTLQGTLTDETVAPIQGFRSINYTQASGSLNDWIAYSAQVVGEQQQDKTNTFIFYANYDGDDNDLQVVVWDDTNSANIAYQVYVTSTGYTKRYEVKVSVPSNCVSISVGFQVVVENIGAELIFDLLELNTNPFEFTSVYSNSDYTLTNQTITLGAITTPPTKGTIETDRILYKKNGDMGRFRYEYEQTTGGTSGSGDYLVSLPIINGQQLSFSSNVTLNTGSISGLAVDDVSKTSFRGGLIQLTGSLAAHMWIIPYDATRFRVVLVTTGGSTSAWGSASFTFGNASTEFSLDFEVPIAGWSTITDSVISNGTAGANWTNLGPMTIGAVTTPPTKASNMEVDQVWFSRDKDKAKFKYIYRTDTTATGSATGSGDYLFKLPIVNGQQLSFSSAVSLFSGVATTANDFAWRKWGDFTIIYDGNTYARGAVVPYSATEFRLFGKVNTTSSVNVIGSTQFPTTLVNNGFTIDLEVPIQDWNVENSVSIISPLVRTAMVELQHASGSGGAGTFTSGSYQTIPLNTLSGDTDFLSLNAGQITLSPGKYNLYGYLTAYRVNDFKAKLRNITAGADLKIGTPGQSINTASSYVTASTVNYTLTIEAPTVIELQGRPAATRATDGLGIDNGFGDINIGPWLKIDKLK